MLPLKDLIKFIKLTHRFQRTKRAVLVNGEKRFENDSEHSYQLAMVAWYFIETDKLHLNKDKILKYALVHDLVEIYAGDTHFYYGDKKKKSVREKKALQRLKRAFPRFADMGRLIADYESKKDKESRFVHALDKLLPILNIYLDKGRTWKSDGISLKMLIRGKTQSVSSNPTVQKYFNMIVRELKKHKNYFPQT